MHAGVTSEALLRELRAGLEALASAVPPGCPSPPLLAHGHYPLSTVDFPTHDPGPLGMLRHMARSVRSMQVGGAAHSKVPPASEQRKTIKRIACAAWQLAEVGQSSWRAALALAPAYLGMQSVTSPAGRGPAAG